MSGSLEDVFIIGIIQSRYDSRNFLGVDERRCLAEWLSVNCTRGLCCAITKKGRSMTGLPSAEQSA